MCPTSPPTSTAFFQGSARFVYKPWLDPQAHLFFQPFFYGCWFYHYTFRRTSFITGAHTRRLPPFSLFFYNFFHWQAHQAGSLMRLPLPVVLYAP